jgi:hypothetical protein
MHAQMLIGKARHSKREMASWGPHGRKQAVCLLSQPSLSLSVSSLSVDWDMAMSSTNKRLVHGAQCVARIQLTEELTPCHGLSMRSKHWWVG